VGVVAHPILNILKLKYCATFNTVFRNLLGSSAEVYYLQCYILLLCF